jgi:hypothetical protein
MQWVSKRNLDGWCFYAGHLDAPPGQPELQGD